MKTFWIVIPTICLATAVLSKSCLEVKLEHEKNCQKGDPGNYIKCVKTRMKRQSCKYDEQCVDCDCDSCEYSQCDGQCNDCCNSCCTNYVQCHTNHCCHKQCHSECRTYNCRSSCRKSCYDSMLQKTEMSEGEVEQRTNDRIIDRTIVGTGSGGSNNNNNLYSNTSNVNAHNITTVINLKNVINNTNLIDVPINLNYTNKNNISLSETIIPQSSPNGPGSGSLTNDNCCIVIGPRQCVQIQISPYVRCFYLRSKQCGSFCTGTIVHKEASTCPINAYGQPVCQEEAAYIPQPQPRCSYSTTWPYVTCGTQQSASCEGCYGHYFNSQAKLNEFVYSDCMGLPGNGTTSYIQPTKEYKSCSPQCYNDFGAGPLYRQGPLYQPTYSHLPPCYLTPQGCGGVGGFGMMGPYGGGVGGYMGGLGQGFGAGFGYSPQLPMLQPGMSFSQSPIIPFNPQLLGNANNNNAPPLMNSSEVLDGIVIEQYQPNGNNPLVPLYELPEQGVKIDVTITDPNEKQQFQHPRTRSIRKEPHPMRDATVVRV